MSKHWDELMTYQPTRRQVLLFGGLVLAAVAAALATGVIDADQAQGIVQKWRWW